MDELAALLKQITLGEDSNLELKDIKYSGNSAIDPNRGSLTEEMVAMASAHGGTIILGVDDKTHSITDLPLDKLDLTETWVRDIINEFIQLFNFYLKENQDEATIN